jgi:RNA polymerase sigma factor (sigma-70 family)
MLESSEPATSPTDPHADDELARALDRLTEVQRAVLLLVRAHGYSYAETAELLGITQSAVTKHVHRGTQRLRQLLEEHK